MTRPGDRLRSFARHVCSAETLERLIDPVLADLQFEHGNAVRAGRTWHARLHVVAGYLAFWKTLSVCATRAYVGAIRNWAAADNHALGRTLVYSAGVIVTLIALLVLLPFSAVLRRADVHPFGMLFLYLVPQAIPIAVTFGLPIGILVGLRGRYPTRRIRLSIVCLAIVSAAFTFVVCAWLLPEANQAFRVLVQRRSEYLARGANELTFSELSAKLAAIRRTGSPADVMPLVFSYHMRLAASAAPIIWGVFALGLSTMTRRTVVSIPICIIAGITYVTYAAFVVGGPTSTYPWRPLAAVIWLPNVLFALLTYALWRFAIPLTESRP